MAGISRRSVLGGGAVVGVAVVSGGVYTAARAAVAGVNPSVSGEAAHVRTLRKALDDAAAGIAGSDGVDSAGRIIVKAGYTGVPTYTLLNTLVIGGNTLLDATGARFVAKFGTASQEYKLDGTNDHSPTPVYQVDGQGLFTAPIVVGAKAATMLINHVPAATTKGYAAPGNIKIRGGEWDPISAYVWQDTGAARARADKAPPMNALTFIHTQDIEIEGVTVYNVKWWHAVELNAVRRAVVQDSFFKGWVENPTAGLWQGEAVQLDLPSASNTWAGAVDGTPTVDVRVVRNHVAASGSQPSWAKLIGSHTGGAKAGQVHARVLIEGNVVDDAKWDAIGPMNTTALVIRGNTVNRGCGGIYVSPMTAKTPGRPPVPVAANPLNGVEITGNTVTVARSAAGVTRHAVRINSVSEGGFDSKVTDVVVTGNTATGDSVNGKRYSYGPLVEFRAGVPPQND